MERNVLGDRLEPCSLDPLTGFYRDGCCRTGAGDLGSHTICAVVTAEFLEYQQSIGNDLSTPMPEYRFPGLTPGDRWCVTTHAWLRAHEEGVPRIRRAGRDARARPRSRAPGRAPGVRGGRPGRSKLDRHMTTTATRFSGSGLDVQEWFERLAANNNREYFSAHRDFYQESVRDQMNALLTSAGYRMARRARRRQHAADGSRPATLSPVRDWLPRAPTCADATPAQPRRIAGGSG